MDDLLIPTGSLALDHLLGGGLRRGRITTYAGGESSGKSSLALIACRSLNVVYVDAEQSLSQRSLNLLHATAATAVVVRVNDLETVVDVVGSMAGAVDLIVLDTISAMTTSTPSVEPLWGQASRALPRAWERVAPMLGRAIVRTRTALLALSHAQPLWAVLRRSSVVVSLDAGPPIKNGIEIVGQWVQASYRGRQAHLPLLHSSNSVMVDRTRERQI